MKKKNTEKISRIVERVVDILNERKYITSWDLKSLGLHVDRKILERLENLLKGLKWFKLVHVSTRKYVIFPTKFSQLYIAYLEGYEGDVISFLLNNLVNEKAPHSILRWILKINNVPQKLYELI